jgi:hypothetical protein
MAQKSLKSFFSNPGRNDNKNKKRLSSDVSWKDVEESQKSGIQHNRRVLRSPSGVTDFTDSHVNKASAPITTSKPAAGVMHSSIAMMKKKEAAAAAAGINSGTESVATTEDNSQDVINLSSKQSK